MMVKAKNLRLLAERRQLDQRIIILCLYLHSYTLNVRFSNSLNFCLIRVIVSSGGACSLKAVRYQSLLLHDNIKRTERSKEMCRGMRQHIILSDIVQLHSCI